MEKVNVQNMVSTRTGSPVANQYVIIIDDEIFFQSYRTLIAKLDKDGEIYVNENAWKFSKTTSKYLNEWFYNYTTYNYMDKKLGEELIHKGIIKTFTE